MSNLIFRSISEPIRTGLSWEQCWKAEDKGCIRSWETGRELRVSRPELASCAERGQLPALGWKGGLDKPIKGEKWGTYLYLAQLQGLKGENLKIDLSEEVTLVCASTGASVTYTSDASKYRCMNAELGFFCA